MNLLISAYACAPGLGSDHAVGWTWVTEAHRQGHCVWALASPVHRDAILRACSSDPNLAGIRWVFPEVPGWALQPGIEPRRERTYNLLWQRQAARHGRLIIARERIDVVHHATWAGIRAPTFLGGLGPPLIIGPVGGGETSTAGLRDCIGMRGRVLEFVRDLSNRTITLNPAVRPGLRNAAAIFVSTPETERLFRGRLRRKTRVFSQLALQTHPEPAKREFGSGPPAFIYSGRLLYWKGVHIALRAFTDLLARHPGARFTIVGDGPERARLQADAHARGVSDQVAFMPRVPQARLFELYREHDFMLFPSLHDSGGLAALEALAYGLPVACLDLGGPGLLVTEESGIVVPTAERDTDEVAAAMADGVSQALEQPGRLQALSNGAVLRAADFSASRRAQIFYAEVATIGVKASIAEKTGIARSALHSPAPSDSGLKAST